MYIVCLVWRWSSNQILISYVDTASKSWRKCTCNINLWFQVTWQSRTLEGMVFAPTDFIYTFQSDASVAMPLINLFINPGQRLTRLSAVNNFCVDSDFLMPISLLLVAASYRYAIDASIKERALLFCAGACEWRASDMRIIWQNGASDTPTPNMRCTHPRLRDCYVASSPGHSHVFNVAARRKVERLVRDRTWVTLHLEPTWNRLGRAKGQQVCEHSGLSEARGVRFLTVQPIVVQSFN
jgi:hypothetical protein